jgi:hypothetical protein
MGSPDLLVNIARLSVPAIIEVMLFLLLQASAK